MELVFDMDLKTQKRMAADVLDCGSNKVWIDPQRQDDVAEAITKVDIRRLVKEGAIKEKDSKGQSKDKARERKKQKEKGRKKGHGRRKGKEGSRQSEKEKWMTKVRAQRKLLKELKNNDKIKRDTYRDLYKRVKGGNFNSKKQLRNFIENKGLMRDGKNE